MDISNDLIAKLRLLEESVGHKASYRLLDPFEINPRNPLELQSAVRRIADFVGLGSHRFLVTSCAQRANVGGHIELQPGREVFIEISETLLTVPEAVLATLAHEISHKYLHVNNVSCGTGLEKWYETEILTDVTSVWLGLGKLALNGCNASHAESRKTANGTETTTTTHHSCGYLDRSQFAFVYLVTGSMRYVAECDLRRGVTPDALAALENARRLYPIYVRPELRKPDAADLIRERLEAAAEEVQEICADVERDAILLRKACLDPTADFLTKLHRGLRSNLDAFEKRADGTSLNPCLRFLELVELERLVTEWKADLTQFRASAGRYREALASLVRIVDEADGPFNCPADPVLSDLSCPLDGTVATVKTTEGTGVAQCPKCGYRWRVNSVRRREEQHSQPRASWLRKIFQAGGGM